MSDLPDCMVPCFKCGKKLENLYDRGNQPLSGLEFSTHGHYGSTVFDMSAGELVLNICDVCLEEARDKTKRLLYRKIVKTAKEEYTPFEG